MNNFNWAEFVFDLNKLDYCDTRLVRKILSSKQLQSQNWYNQPNIEKLKEILDRYDSSEESDGESSESEDEFTTISSDDIRDGSPLSKDLSKMLGANKIQSNVQIERHLIIPYVLKMDLQSGEFLPISKTCTKMSFSSRYIDNNELL